MLSEFGIEGIYIIHAKKGYELHEKRIKGLFGELGLSFEFVTEGDPDSFSKLKLENYFVPDIKLGSGTLSCTLNHIFAYERIVKNKNRYALVFENDPFFLGDFLKDIKDIALEVQADGLKGFIISLENTCLRFPSMWQTKKNQKIYPALTGRAAGAYLIDYEGASRIVENLKQDKCHTVIDWWHNSLIERRVIKMFWAHPPLVEQGSHNGLLSSTISSKPKSLSRRVQWLVQKSYKMSFRRLFNEKLLDANGQPTTNII